MEGYRANERATAATWKPLGFWLFGLIVLMAVIAAVLRVGELRRFARLTRAATLGVMLSALGQAISPVFVFGSFVVADVVAFIGPIPLGLGVFEGTAVTMLTMTGVSIEAALAATLLLRGFTFWLPTVPGMWLAHRELGGV